MLLARLIAFSPMCKIVDIRRVAPKASCAENTQRKAFFHLLLKWFIRPVVAQQNAFNQAAGRMLQELAEAQERTAREVRVLAALVAELEGRAEAPPAGAPAPEPPPGAGGAAAAGGGEPRR